MNLKLILKTIFLIAVLLLVVWMGMNNRDLVTFSLPHILPTSIKPPAALMYTICFAVGLLTGTILTAGGGKKGSGSSSKPKGDR